MSTIQILNILHMFENCVQIDLVVTFQQDLWIAIQVELVKRTLYL